MRKKLVLVDSTRNKTMKFTNMMKVKLIARLLVASLILCQNAVKSQRRAESKPNRTRDKRFLSLNIQSLTANFQRAKAKLIESIRDEYGAEFYPNIFEDVNRMNNHTQRTSIGRNAFFLGSSNALKSWERVQRKIMIRILEKTMVSQESPVFVWATAGAQEAAGRGNFFVQQYTNVLQQKMKDVFRSVGVQLETRPYAMGNLQSAPEVAACAMAILGEDADLVSWDFAPSDARHYWRLEFFAHRVIRMDHHPALLVLQAGKERQDIVEHLTDLGMGILRMDRDYVGERMVQGFPDSRGYTLDEMIDAGFTEHVRFFRCGKSFENGPGCGDYKFTHNGTCDEREYQSRWHPGWKWHAFQGNLYSLFLTEVIEDALEAIKKEGSDPNLLLSQLQKQEEQDFKEFEASQDFIYGEKWSDAFKGTLTAHQLADSPVFCHTARIPAHSRFMGYVTDNPFPGAMCDFDQGISLKLGLDFNVGELLLTYDERDRQDCPALIQVDYKDFFLASGDYDGFQTMIVPNDMEKSICGDHQPFGIILVCGAGCERDECPPETLDLEALEQKKALVQLNGKPVDHVVPYEDCYLLADETGSITWPADENGQYTLGVRVDVPGKYMRLGSVIIW